MQNLEKMFLYRTEMFAQCKRIPFAAFCCIPELCTKEKRVEKSEYKPYFGAKWKQGLLFKRNPRFSLTCTAEPPRSQPWLGWSPAGKHSCSHSCNIPGQSLPKAHPCAESPPCTWLSPGDSRCGCKQTGIDGNFTPKPQLAAKCSSIYWLWLILVGSGSFHPSWEQFQEFPWVLWVWEEREWVENCPFFLIISPFTCQRCSHGRCRTISCWCCSKPHRQGRGSHSNCNSRGETNQGVLGYCWEKNPNTNPNSHLQGTKTRGSGNWGTPVLQEAANRSQNSVPISGVA